MGLQKKIGLPYETVAPDGSDKSWNIYGKRAVFPAPSTGQAILKLFIYFFFGKASIRKTFTAEIFIFGLLFTDAKAFLNAIISL